MIARYRRIYRSRSVRVAHALYRVWGASLRIALRAGHPPERRFVIYGRGRNGSTLLVDLLNRHPSIYCDKELLATPMRLSNPYDFIDKRSRLGGAPVYGFKLLSYQLPTHQGIDDQSWFLDRLEAEGFEIIYVYRRSLLRAAISATVAHQSGEFHRTKAKDDAPRFVDPDVLERGLARAVQRRDFEVALLRDRSCLRICYEDDLELEQQPVMDRVFAHLGLPSVPVKTRLKKIVGTNLAGSVRNYAELRDRFAGTPYAEFFD